MPAAPLLAAALRAQGDGVVISALGPQGGSRIVFANDGFCRMIGRPLRELLGQPHATLHADPADFEKLARRLATAATERALNGEGYLLHKNKDSRHAAWTFSAIRGPRGRSGHLVATYRDTTEKRRLQDALAHAQRLDAVGRLAGGIAHDFNNLLSVINGYCEMLAAQVADRPQALREVNEIHRSGLRAATLTRQLLAFGRRQPLDPRVLDLNRIIRDHAEIMARLVGSAGRVETDLAKDLGKVRADPTQLQQVLFNLVNNARDALRDDGLITISTRNREVKSGRSRRTNSLPPGRYVCLTVTDNGTGMDAETQKHLFEPFFTTKPEGQGTGLGLALVYGVVQQSGGHITVRSALLAGSTFEILFPVVDAPEETAATNSLEPLPATRGHETLLLIERDEVVRKMVAGMLNTDGYRVLAAADAQEAARLARDEPRPVQLLIGSGEGANAELARHLLRKNPQLRLLRVTNDDSAPPPGWIAAAHQAPLMKPFALGELLQLARTLLDQAD